LFTPPFSSFRRYILDYSSPFDAYFAFIIAIAIISPPFWLRSLFNSFPPRAE